MKVGRSFRASRANSVLGASLLAVGGCGNVVAERHDSGSSGAGGSVSPMGCALEGSADVPAEVSGTQASATEVAFAMDQVFLGDRDPNGQPNANAWQALGYDIDCKITTSSSTDVCKSSGGQISPDAPGGRDNSFGANLQPASDGVDANVYIAAGDSTLVFRFTALGSEPNQHGVVAVLYDGRLLAHAPNWDGNDVWPIAAPRQLDGYVSGGTWVSGQPVTLRVKMSVEGTALFITVHHAVVTAVFAPDLSGAASGQIAGILDRGEMDYESQRAFCPPQGNDFWGQIADIMADGTQAPGKTCDGVSIGLGFTLRRVQVGASVEQEIPVSSCSGANP